MGIYFSMGEEVLAPCPNYSRELNENMVVEALCAEVC